jgi:hypothetical protein
MRADGRSSSRALVAATALAVACGARTPLGGPETDGAAQPGPQAGMDAGSNDASEIPADAGQVSRPPPSGKTYAGYVQLIPNEMGFQNVFVASGEPPAEDPLSPCPGAVAGDCCYFPAVPMSSGLVSAGEIDWTDVTQQMAVASIGPGPADDYTSLTTPDSGLVDIAPGDTVHVAVAGAAVDAFAATLVVPEPLTDVHIDSPNASKNADLTVRWTPGATPGWIDTIYVNDSDDGIGCVVYDSAGGVTIPAALMGMLQLRYPGDVPLLSSRDAIQTVVVANGRIDVAVTQVTIGQVPFR